MQEHGILKRSIKIVLFLSILFLPSIVFSNDNALATVEIEQEEKNFNITIATKDDGYILEDTLDISVVGKDASLNSVFYQDSEIFDNHNVFWNKTIIKVVVESQPETDFKIQTTYQVCNNLHVCSKLQKFEKSFKLPKPIAIKKTTADVNAVTLVDPAIAAQGAFLEKNEECEKLDICPKIHMPDQTHIDENTDDYQEVVSEQDSIAGMLKDKSLILTLVTFFGFGLLLAFTPCMLPVIPILSAVIISKKERISTKEGFLLSLTYVVSMSVVYAIAGVAAASLGCNIQAFFQETWIIIIVSIFFFILSLAMFGTFSIEMPKKVQSFLNSKATYGKERSYFSVIFLGILSALIVGPCVAPPLAGALIYISQTGDQLIGGLSLFVMSLGMGVPLLLIGAGAGKFLPKPGPWMTDVKLFFGFAMIGFAIWILSRILDTQVVLLMWGILLTAIAIFLNIFENKACTAIDSIYHLKKLIALLILLYGIVLMIGAIAGAKHINDPLEPFKGKFVQTGVPSRVTFKTISAEQLDSVVKQATKPVMAVFTADWCDNCKELDANVFSQSDVALELEGFESFKIDITQNRDIDIEQLKRFSLFGPPGTIFFDKNKKELKAYRLSGNKEKEVFMEHIRKVKKIL